MRMDQLEQFINIFIIHARKVVPGSKPHSKGGEDWFKGRVEPFDKSYYQMTDSKRNCMSEWRS